MTKDKKMRKGNTIQVILTVLLVGAAFAIGSMWTELRMMKKDKTEAAKQVEADQGPEKAKELADDLWQELLKEPAFEKGNDEAKVTMVEFTDYQCPFCKRHFDQSDAQLMKDYVDTGKVKYVLRDLPLSFHANAQTAAEAARCAGDQNKYEEYHNKLFENQTVWAEEADASLSFKSYAVNLGLNQSEFASCLDTGKYTEAVEADLDLARRAGASGTPTFFINRKVLVGAQPYTAFKNMIEGELK